MHEHLFMLTPDVQTNYPREWGREEDRIAGAVAMLEAAAAHGAKTFVDPTVIGHGRYIPRVQAIAAPPLSARPRVTDGQIDMMLVTNPSRYFEELTAY